MLNTGEVLAGRYKIEKVLGQGGMGAVYEASDLHLTVKKWALKEMYDSFTDPEERKQAVQQFTAEAHILASLDHPNLPGVTDFFTHNSSQFLVMEFVEGKTLEELLAQNKGPFSIPLAVNYALQLCDVLEYLHSRTPPVIFRDLKPSNIMITPDRKIKLIDFGIARFFRPEKSRDTIALGTPGYASPEQYGRGQTDARSDIFSLGATLYALLTGEDPQDNPFKFEKPSKFNSKIPPELDEIILKAVAIDPEQRFQSASEVKQALSRISAPTTSTLVMAGGSSLFFPQVLDFGVIKKGDIQKKSFAITGDAKGNLSKDQPWMRVSPSKINGKDAQAEVTVYTTGMMAGGRYEGNVIFTIGKKQEKLPVIVNLDPQHLTIWANFFAFLCTIVSLIPLVGFFGFIWLMVIYYSTPRNERSNLAVLVKVSSFASAFYAALGSLLFVLFKLRF